MNTIALQNINILQSLKENDVFSFNGYNLTINNKDNSNIEYGLYFTFHEIFTLFDMDSRSRNNILRDLNSSIDNLYENKFFLNIIEESDDIKNIMDDICSKVDVLTEKFPFTHYGKTKSAFDQVLKNKLLGLKFCSIAPGTIINPYSKKDNLLKNSLRKLSSRPLIWLLKIFSPSGNYACVHIDDLISALVKECLNITSEHNMKVYKLFKNYSKKIPIYDLVTYISGSKPIFKINFIPILFFNIIAIFFPKKIMMKLIVYFVDIDYISEYSSIKERQISEYFDFKKF